MAPIWVNKLVNDLSEQDVVSRVHVRPDFGIHILYKTGITESYAFTDHPRHCRLTRQEGRLTVRLEPHRQYELGLTGRDDGFGHHLRLIVRSGTLIDKSLGIQRMVAALMAIGYRTDLPEAALQDDLRRLREFDSSVCFTGKMVDFYPRIRGGHPGRMILEHFFPCGTAPSNSPRGITIECACSSPMRLWTAIKKLARKKAPITTRNVQRTLRAGPCRHSPVGYMAILKRLKPRGSVLDLHPSFGHKALACAIMGIKYVPADDLQFSAAMAAGFGNRIGLTIGGTIGLAIADSNFHRPYIGQMPAAPLALAYGDEVALSVGRGRPRAKIPINLHYTKSHIDHLLVW